MGLDGDGWGLLFCDILVLEIEVGVVYEWVGFGFSED